MVEWERDRRRNSPEGVSRGGARLGLAGVGRKWPSGHEIERGLALEHARGTRNALVAMGWWFGHPSVTLVGDGGSAAAGNAGELALGGSEAGVWVCGFGVRAQGQRRPWQGTVGLGSAAARSAAAEQGVCGGGSAGVGCLGADVGHGL